MRIWDIAQHCKLGRSTYQPRKKAHSSNRNLRLPFRSRRRRATRELNFHGGHRHSSHRKDHMLAAQRIQSSYALSRSLQRWSRGVFVRDHALSSSTASLTNKGLLDLQEVETILNNVKADDVKVIPVRKDCDWADYMVFATGRSTWHVKNIAQALIYKACFFICISVWFYWSDVSVWAEEEKLLIVVA